MIDRVKNWLGIEGVKIQLDVPAVIDGKSQILYGIVNFTTMKEQHIESISFSLIETYTRGRRKDKRIDDHLLAREVRKVDILIKENSSFAYPFELPFVRYESNVETLSRKTLLKPLTKAMKFMHGAKSEFHISVSVVVKGNKLQPFVKQEISII